MNCFTSRILGVVLTLLLSGVAQPALLLAQENPAPQQNTTQNSQSQAAGQAASQQQPDQSQTPERQQQEDKASQQMINSAPVQGKPLPESPDTVRAREQAQQAQQQTAAPQFQTQPSGTAAAQEGKVAGTLASRPAGAAIAPAKQKQVRSFLIKMGVIAGAGVALGTVYALSRASGPTPPGAR